jgi:hypothetical protein
MMISLLGVWKSQLVRLKAVIDQALGVLLEGLKGFWLGLSQKPKLVARHKGGWVAWGLKIWNVLLILMPEALVLAGVKAGLYCGFRASLRV